MRPYRTDHRLWGLIFGCLFVPLVVVRLVFEPKKRLVELYEDSVWLAGTCAVVAWLLQAMAVLCGVRLTGRPDPEQAADYDEPPPAA